jgi:chromosome segregation ATPase
MLDNRDHQNKILDEFGHAFSQVLSTSTTLASTPRDTNSSSSSTNPNSPRNHENLLTYSKTSPENHLFPLEKTARAVKLQRENQKLRDQAIKFKLQSREWESKAASLAEAVGDLQQELISKNKSTQELKKYQQLIITDSETKKGELKEKHQTDLSRLSEKARQLDEKNLALSSQIQMLEDDLLARDGKMKNFQENYLLETHRNSLHSIKENYRLEIGKLKNNYHQERENAEMLRLKMGQLESDVERESNDSRAKTRQIKLLKSELKSVGSSLHELQEHSETENKRLNEQSQEIERQAVQLAHDYTKKLEHLSVEMTQIKSIKTQLEIENSDLLSQINEDVKTYANSKKLKVALALLHQQKKNLEVEGKRLRIQVATMKKQGDKNNECSGSEIASLISKNEILNKKNISYEARLNGYDAKLAAAEKEVNKLTFEIDTKNADFERLQGIKEKLMAKVKSLESSIMKLQDTQKHEISSNVSENELKQQEIDGLKEALRRISRESKLLNNERIGMKASMDEFRKDYKSERDQKDALLADLAELKMELAKNDDRPWKTAYDASNAEREKLMLEIRELKEDNFRAEAKHLDLDHEVKKSKSFHSQLLSKNAEIAQLKAKLAVKKSKSEHEMGFESDQKTLKLAHDATIQKSRQLLKNNKELRDEVRRLSFRQDPSASSSGRSSKYATAANSLLDLDSRYKDLQKKVQHDMNSGSTSVTPNLPPSLSEESETIVDSNITEISREFSRKLEKLVADENSSDITEMSHCTPSELNWPERERPEQ